MKCSRLDYCLITFIKKEPQLRLLYNIVEFLKMVKLSKGSLAQCNPLKGKDL
jgi:hypothetical protein